jgi:peptidoglycan/LPS O-acetylase OafA/YrhL
MTSSSPQIAANSRDRKTGGYLPSLDGWRAIAILLVLIAHSGMFYFSDVGPHPSSRLQSYAIRGSAGVDIFFAISGFLICTLLLREQKKTGRINLRSFYIRRVFRILPPYLLYLAVIGVLASTGYIMVTRQEFISCLLFFRNYLPLQLTRDGGWYTGHFWSLAVEEHFYLLWPALLLLLHRRRAALTAIVVILAITIWRTLDLRFHFIPVNAVQIFEHRTDTRLDCLIWGCLFATAYTSDAARQWLKAWINPYIWLASAAVLIVLTAEFFGRGSLRPAIAATVRPPLFALLVVATVIQPQWLVARILEDARLRWIGRISYSLYIWQQLFLVVHSVPRPLPFGRWQEVPRAFLCIAVCALASYYLVEQPLIRLGHKLSGRRSPTAIAPATPAIAPAGSSV